MTFLTIAGLQNWVSTVFEAPFGLQHAQNALCARFRALLCCCLSAFVENQMVEIIGQIGQRQFGLGPCQANRADEQAIPILLPCKDMLHGGADRRFLRIGFGIGFGLRHGPARRFAAVNAACQHVGISHFSFFFER